MSIKAVCTGCGKSLSVKDELKGKTIRCPACKATFVAGAAAAPLPTGRARASTLGEKRKTSGPALSISPTVILGGLVLVVVVGSIIFWVIGPGKTHSRWNEISGDVYDEVESVTDFCLKAETSTNGSWNSRKAAAMPKVNDGLTLFAPHALAFSMPDEINFKGTTTEGDVKGVYHTKTKEIDIDMDIGGTALSTGIVTRKGRSTIKCTGRMTNGQVTAEINGKKASIYTPPPDPDEN